MLLLAKSSEKATDNIKYKAIIYFTSQDEVHSETDKDGTIEWSFFLDHVPHTFLIRQVPSPLRLV